MFFYNYYKVVMGCFMVKLYSICYIEFLFNLCWYWVKKYIKILLFKVFNFIFLWVIMGCRVFNVNIINLIGVYGNYLGRLLRRSCIIF